MLLRLLSQTVLKDGVSGIVHDYINHRTQQYDQYDGRSVRVDRAYQVTRTTGVRVVVQCTVSLTPCDRIGYERPKVNKVWTSGLLGELRSKILAAGYVIEEITDGDDRPLSLIVSYRPEED